MGKYVLKTQKNDASVEAFLQTIDDPQKQKDCREILSIMHDISGQPATMW